MTACFNEELLCKAVTEQVANLKIAMEAGSIFCDGFNDIDDKCFEYSATHSDTPKGNTAEQLSKVWQLSNEVAKKTLDVKTQLQEGY